ncbi:MAG: rhodanese-like domain-containing protein [Thermoanaerobaculia bacterium]
MFVKRFFEPLIAQNSYLIGCAAAGEAIVIDPNRDIQPYLDTAEREGLKITHVTETHIHADFLSGSRELAHRTGASLCLSDEGDKDWKYQFDHDRKLTHGDRITIGNVKLDVLHTPGHTPEHLTFLVTDGAAADKPIAAVTGDFVFVGDVGRPDLLERAAKMAGTMEQSAKTLWKSLQEFAKYPDWLQLWPGHGAGSSCGKGISAIPHSTLGYERLFNWAFTAKSEGEFVTNVLTGQPEPPKYYATMKQMNKQGPLLLADTAVPRLMRDDQLKALLRLDALVIDTRPATRFATGHVPGTLNLPLNGSFVTWAGWLVPYTADFYVIVDDGPAGQLPELRRALSLVGLDRVAGYFSDAAVAYAAAHGTTLGTIDQMTPDELRTALNRLPGEEAAVIDVRHASEWKEGHLPSAIHIPLGHLAERIAEVPADREVVVHCQGGSRSAIAASLLKKLGRQNVANLTGGYKALASNSPTVANSGTVSDTV